MFAITRVYFSKIAQGGGYILFRPEFHALGNSDLDI